MALNAVVCVIGGLGFSFSSVGTGYRCSRIVSSAEAGGGNANKQCFQRNWESSQVLNRVLLHLPDHKCPSPYTSSLILVR